LVSLNEQRSLWWQ